MPTYSLARQAQRWVSLFIIFITIPLSSAHAFADDEARKAILDLRMRIETQRQVSDGVIEQQAHSILEISKQLQELRQELAELRGQTEKLEVKTESLVKQSTPKEVTLDGLAFLAVPQETADYEAGLEKLRSGEYASAVNIFQSFTVSWPNSGYTNAAYFWLGSAQYGHEKYKDAIASFSKMLQLAPNHSRASEALLSIANCHIALGDKVAVKTTLERLVRDYPATSAAQQAKDRLAKM